MASEHICTYLTAIGKVSLSGDGTRITGVYLPTANLPVLPDVEDPLLAAAAQELGEYLSGRRREFDLPLACQGTAFQ